VRKALATALPAIACALLLAPGAAPAQTAAEQTEIERLRTDWAQLQHYRDENYRLPPPQRATPRVVFLGDSITQSWDLADLGATRLEVLNRGISGQTTPQMLVRFRQDVVDLHPAVVHILAGTNDLAGNTGPTTLHVIENNISSMVDIAQVNHIAVVLASVLPTLDYPWRHDLQPAPRIAALNAWMRELARRRGLIYVDYFAALADRGGGLKAAWSEDGVHPNTAGYAVMAPLALRAVTQAALRGSPK
jgi:acyl-CoA thioesterase I